LRSWATFECLAVVDHPHGTVTQLRTELLGHTPILLAETRNGTQGASAVVVPVDPAGGRELDVREGPVGAGVEDVGADALGLVEPVDRLHQRVVQGVADGPDRRGDALEGEMLGQSNGGVLSPSVAVMDQVPW